MKEIKEDKYVFKLIDVLVNFQYGDAPSDVSKDGLLKTHGVILDQLGPVHLEDIKEQVQRHPRR